MTYVAPSDLQEPDMFSCHPSFVVRFVVLKLFKPCLAPPYCDDAHLSQMITCTSRSGPLCEIDQGSVIYSEIVAKFHTVENWLLENV